MNNEINTYVICSTLNQMVNYLPLSIFSKNDLKNQNINIEKIYNITIKGENERNSRKKRFPNKKWDKNFEDVVRNNKKFADIEIIDISIARKQSLSIEEIYKRIDKKLDKDIKDEPILWNITGGQRNLLMGIYRIIDERKTKGIGDKVIYLEGNSNQMMILDNSDSEEKGRFLPYEKYFDKDLDIETALSLIGLRTQDYTAKEPRKNLLEKNCDGEYKCFDEYKKYLDLYKLYTVKNKDERDKKIEGLRNIILRLNKEKNGTEWEEVESYVKGMQCEDVIKEIGEDIKERKQKDNGKSDEETKKGLNPLGFILEYMTVAAILECVEKNEELKEYFVDMSHSENIYFNKDDDYMGFDRNPLFEFDITLLSGSGQLVIFECKSGDMPGETAKARKYSVYAAGGVYGKPVIITPLLKYQIKNIGKEIEKSKEKFGKDENVYNTLKSTISSATRADMEVWGIDEIENKLEKLFKDVWEG